MRVPVSALAVVLGASVVLSADPPELIFRDPVVLDFFEFPEDSLYTHTAIGDLNGDGRADVLVVGTGDEVRYLPGTPDGSVAASMTTLTDSYRGGYVTGLGLFEAVDMDGDGDDDVAFDTKFKAIVVLRNDGGGVFTEISADAGAEVLRTTRVLFDLGGDGDLDLLVSVYELPYMTAPGYRLFENLGDSFAAREKFLFASGAIPRACDLNGDGLDDVVVIHPTQVVVLRQTPAGALVAEAPVLHGTGIPMGFVIDAEGDGDQDVVAYGRLLRNDGMGALTEDAAVYTAVPLSFPVVVDFDLDGLQDVVEMGNSATASFYRNTGAGLAAAVALPIGATLGIGARFAVEDLDEDAKPDLAVVTHLSNKMAILRQAGFPAPEGLVVAPSAIVQPGESTVALEGDGFRDGATVDLGPGIAATSVVVESPTAAAVTLDVAPGIGGGERIVKLSNPDRQTVVATVEVHSLDAAAAAGRLTDAPGPARDVLRLRGALARNGLSDNDAFAGRDDGLRLEIGTGPARFVLTVPAGDPRWREARRGRRLVFQTLTDEFPRIRLSVDALRETFDLKVSFFDYPEAPADASLGVFSGDDLGRDSGTWSPDRSGRRFRLR